MEWGKMGTCFHLFVGIAQTVERDLYTVKATGSMPVLNMIQLKEPTVLWWSGIILALGARVSGPIPDKTRYSVTYSDNL